MYTPEDQVKIAEYRKKALAGTLTVDEVRDSIRLLTQGRVAAASTSAASKSRKSATAKKAAINSDDLLSELDKL